MYQWSTNVSMVNQCINGQPMYQWSTNVSMVNQCINGQNLLQTQNITEDEMTFNVEIDEYMYLAFLAKTQKRLMLIK